MYIARRELKTYSRGEKPVLTVFRRGDVIPKEVFDSWNIHTRRAHLNMEHVEVVPDEKAEAVEAPPKKVEVSAKPTEETFNCGTCHKPFKSAQAVKAHATLKHKQKAG